MMQVYTDALRESKTGPVQYVVQNGAYVVRAHNERTLLDLLHDGYELKAKCNNGVLEQVWRLEADISCRANLAAAKVILEKLSMATSGWKTLYISTQEFYDEHYICEAVYMYIDIWKDAATKPDTYCVTPKDRTVDERNYKRGQEQAHIILDILSHFSVKQDAQALIQMLKTRPGAKNMRH